jgi:hypothetical protein
MKKRITKCPHCGSDRGMAVRFKANGTDIYSFDGHFQDEEITECCTYNKSMTCCDCGKRIMSYDEFMTHYAIDELTGEHLKQ